MPGKVLFVTHPKRQCGVYEYGMKVFEAVRKSDKYDFVHAECHSLADLQEALALQQPDFIIYNYHPAVMPWICKKSAKGIYVNTVANIKIPQIGIIHEVTQDVADSATAYRNKIILGDAAKKLNALFDFYIAPDPTLLLKNPYVFKTGRLVPRYINSSPTSSIPVIGSFGFATPNKGFEKLVRRVVEEFDEAIIKINMPFASYGDENGANAQAVAQQCREIVAGTSIQLQISHDYLSDQQLLEYLSACSLIAFMYEDRKGRGISSATDLALAVGRPLALSDCPMFRHILSAVPTANADQYSLKSILQSDISSLQRLCMGWDEANLLWEYERILVAVEYRTKHPYTAKMGIKRTVQSFINKLLTKPGKSFTWLGNTRAATDDDLTADATSSYTPVILGDKDGFNRILDDRARQLYQPAIETLFQLAPATMAKKIARANVQQAFIFDTVYRHLGQYPNPKLLCVGSYEDTASMSLQKLGYPVEEIDPMINYYLQEYVSKPTTKHATYDIIFSTSVIEHDPDDQSFIECIGKLLAPGGMAVITCDYKDGWKLGEPKPEVDARFYIKNDLEERLLSYVPDCRLVDQPDWDCPNPDFLFLNKYQYTFATFTFIKNK